MNYGHEKVGSDLDVVPGERTGTSPHGAGILHGDRGLFTQDFASKKVDEKRRRSAEVDDFLQDSDDDVGGRGSVSPVGAVDDLKILQDPSNLCNTRTLREGVGHSGGTTSEAHGGKHVHSREEVTSFLCSEDEMSTRVEGSSEFKSNCERCPEEEAEDAVSEGETNCCRDHTSGNVVRLGMLSWFRSSLDSDSRDGSLIAKQGSLNGGRGRSKRDSFRGQPRDHQPTAKTSSPPTGTPRRVPGAAKFFPWSPPSHHRHSSLLSPHFVPGPLNGSVRPTDLSSPCASQPVAKAFSALGLHARTRTGSGSLVSDQGHRVRPLDPSYWRSSDTFLGIESQQELSHSRRWTRQDIHADSPAFGLSGRRLPLRFCSGAELLSPRAVVGESVARCHSPANSTSSWGVGSTLGSQESDKTSVEVHDFLEECVGLSDEQQDWPMGHGHTGVARTGDSNNSMEGGMYGSLHATTLDAQHTTSHVDARELREALLAVEDLHLGELPLTMQTELIDDLDLVRFTSGEIIYREGEPSVAVYFTLPGTNSVGDGNRLAAVERKLISEVGGVDGDEQRAVEVLPAKRFFGEEGLVYSVKHRRTSTVRAVVDMSCAVLHSRDFPKWSEFRLFLLMKKVALLAKLPPRLQTTIFHDLHYVEFKAGETIVTEGEPGDHFYMITEGTATVTTRVHPAPLINDDVTNEVEVGTGIDYDDSSGTRSPSTTPIEGDTAKDSSSCITESELGSVSFPNERILTRLYEGSCFGEMALIYDEPRNASVHATTEVVCIYLEKEAFGRYLADTDFQKPIEEAAFRIASYREQRDEKSMQHLTETGAMVSTQTMDDLSPSPLPDAQTVRAIRRKRSSFRCTSKMTRTRHADTKAYGKVVNNYRIGKKIGEGSFGAVYEVAHIHTAAVYAMKVVKKPRKRGQRREDHERTLLREVSAMQTLRHPNVVTLWEVINDPRSHEVYMIEEFMKGGALLKEKYAVEPVPEEVAAAIFIQAARGLHYIHSVGICHGDIKPSNILEDTNGTVKLADFGAAVILNQDSGKEEDRDFRRSNGSGVQHSSMVWKEHRHQVDGTPGFQAPELFGEDGVSRVSFASDVWALGITLYQMVVGRMPFFGKTYCALIEAIKMEQVALPAGYDVEPSLVNLLRRMLEKDPARRITLAKAMRHEWVTREGVWLPQWDEKQDGEARSIISAHRERGEQWRRLSQSSPLPLGRTSCGERWFSEDQESREDSTCRNPSSGDFRTPSSCPGPFGHWNQSLPSTSPNDARDYAGTPNPPRAHLQSWLLGQHLKNMDNIGGSALSPRFVENLVEDRTIFFPPSYHTEQITLSQPSAYPEPCRVDGSSEAICSEGMVQKLPTRFNAHTEEAHPQRAESPMYNRIDVKSRASAARHRSLPPTPRSSEASRVAPLPISRQPFGLPVPERNKRVDRPSRHRHVFCPQIGEALGATPSLLRDELDDAMAVERSQSLVRKPDFLMLRASSSWAPNTRVVLSTVKAFSPLRASQGGEIGSRRSSVWQGRDQGPPSLSNGKTDDTNGACQGRAPCRKYPRCSGSVDRGLLKSNTVRSMSSASSCVPCEYGVSLPFPVGLNEISGDEQETSAPVRSTIINRGDLGTTNGDHEVEEARKEFDTTGKFEGIIKSAGDTLEACEEAPGRRSSSSRRSRLSLSAIDDLVGHGHREDSEHSQSPSTAHVKTADEILCSGEDAKRVFSALGDGGSSLCATSNREVTDKAGGSDAEMGDTWTASWNTVKETRQGIQRDKHGGDGNQDEADKERWGGSFLGSDDEIGEETSVADITEYLERIGDSVMEREDKELRSLSRDEVRALEGGGHRRSLSCTSCAEESRREIGELNGIAPESPVGKTGVGHVQARPWADQVNLNVGVRFGMSLKQGSRCFMEDTAMCLADAFSPSSGSRRSTIQRHPSSSAVAVNPFGDTTSGDAAAYFGVFDGHGGAHVALHLQNFLHCRVFDDPNFPADVPQAIANGCITIDLECLEDAHLKRLVGTQEQHETAFTATSLKQQMAEQDFCGAVAAIAIIHRSGATKGLYPPFTPSSGSSLLANGGSTPWVFTETFLPVPTEAPSPYQPVILYVANVGDCRAVLCRSGKAVALTQDHTPSQEVEATRVEEAGGFISRGRVNGILGVSRSFGDIHCKVYPPRKGKGLWEEQQVISRPEVHTIEVTEADSFLILASDGVWGVLSNQQAVSYVHRRLLTHRDVQRAAVELVDKALLTSGDNCSCVVVCLNQVGPCAKKRSLPLQAYY